jgi:hypothetical protein
MKTIEAPPSMVMLVPSDLSSTQTGKTTPSAGSRQMADLIPSGWYIFKISK